MSAATYSGCSTITSILRREPAGGPPIRFAVAIRTRIAELHALWRVRGLIPGADGGSGPVPTALPRPRGSVPDTAAGRLPGVCGPGRAKAPPHGWRGLRFVPLNVGGDLLSHTLPGAVPSALEGLATGFGMGPGVPPPPQPPTPQTTNHLRLRSSGVVVCSGSHSGCEQQVCGVSPRPISTGRLHPSQGFHPRPINPMVCRGPYPRPQAGWWETSSWNELPA